MDHEDQAKMYLEALGSAAFPLHSITGAIRIKCLNYSICIFPLVMNFKAKGCRLIFQKGTLYAFLYAVAAITLPLYMPMEHTFADLQLCVNHKVHCILTTSD